MNEALSRDPLWGNRNAFPDSQYEYFPRYLLLQAFMLI